jgi:DNA-binding beta-propeller fold protein YncE
VAAANRVFVANGSADRVDVLDAATLATLTRIGGLADADNVRLDAKEGLVYVGYGSGALRVLDARSGESRGDIALAGHPESFQLEQSGTRIFVNVPTARHVAVIDRASRKVVATWGLQGASSNFPMALDERTHRLYVGTRSPAALLVFDTASGALAGRIPIGGDVDDVFFDPATRRLYAVCGEGVVSVIAQTDADHHTLLGTVKTAGRARTGWFDPASRQLFVAVPAGMLGSAELRVYRAH